LGIIPKAHSGAHILPKGERTLFEALFTRHKGRAARGAAALLLLLAGCSTRPSTPDETAPPPAAAHVPIIGPPIQTAPTATSSEPAVVLHHGTGVVVAPAATPLGGAPESGGGDINLNFVDSDVREVLRAVLGDLLKLNYTIDSKVQATVTVQTSRPIKRADVLPVLQQVLRASGLGLVEANGIYRVMPGDDAARTGTLPVTVGPGGTSAVSTGYNVQILPLQFTSAADMQQTIEPFLPKGASVRADTTRNLLVLSGSAQDLGTAVAMARSFDVDWLAGMSYAIVPLHTSSAKAVAAEAADIFGPNGTIPLPGVLRFAPLERMAAVLVVSPQRGYVDRARDWIERLDRGAFDNSPRIYEYHVQNSRAADLAKVLSELLSSGQVRTVQAQTAPGTQATQIGALGSYDANGAGSPSGASSLSSGIGGGAGAPTLAQGAAGGAIGGQPTTAMATATPGALPATPDTSNSAASAQGTTSSAQSSPPPPGLDLPPVRVVADEKTNTLTIFARPRDYVMIEEALHRLDVVPLQILIEATIAEVTLTNDLQYGLQYFFKSHSNEAQFVGNAPASGAIVPPIAATVPGFNYIFAGANTNIVLNLLASITNLHVISSPELLVLDHQVANLVVGNEVPIPTAQVTYATTGAPVTSNSIQYIDTGVVLRVSPRVNVSGLITLDISQEVSSVAATPAVNTPAGAPTIQQRRIQSTVTVQDGQTIALGGLITDSKQNNRNGIPLLGDIPIIGAIFRSSEISTSRTELLVLLSPKVLHNSIEATEATEELKSRIHALQPELSPVR
jgi:general secretion pathway protein D